MMVMVAMVMVRMMVMVVVVMVTMIIRITMVTMAMTMMVMAGGSHGFDYFIASLRSCTSGDPMGFLYPNMLGVSDLLHILWGVLVKRHQRRRR